MNLFFLICFGFLTECIFKTFSAYYVLWLTVSLTTVWQLSVLKANISLSLNFLTSWASHSSSDVAKCTQHYLWTCALISYVCVLRLEPKYGCSCGNSSNIINYISSRKKQRSTRNRRKGVCWPSLLISETSTLYLCRIVIKKQNKTQHLHSSIR